MNFACKALRTVVYTMTQPPLPYVWA